MVSKILIANRGVVAALALMSSFLVHAAPAQACSVNRTGPRDPAERYAGTNVRRVIGTYRVERIAVPGGYSSPAWVHGRISTPRGPYFEVAHPYQQQLVDCLVYDLPVGDAEGTFYLSRRSRHGRFRILGWSGRHIPGNAIVQPSGEPGEESRN